MDPVFGSSFRFKDHKDIINGVVRGYYVWILSNKSKIFVYDRNSLEIVKSIDVPIGVPDLIVDEGGMKCLLLYENKSLFYISLSKWEINPILISQQTKPTCGTWIRDASKPDYILIGSSTGDVIQLMPEKIRRCGFLYAIDSRSCIKEIHVVTGIVNYVFLLVNDTIICFKGTEPVEVLFAKGSDKRVLVIGSMAATIKNRLIVRKREKSCEISALCPYGIMVFNEVGQTSSSINFGQILHEYQVNDVVSFANTKWGVVFVMNSSFKILFKRTTIHIYEQGITSFIIDERGVVIITKEKVINIPLDDFKRCICNEAIMRNDYGLALLINEGRSTIQELIVDLSKSKEPKEASLILINHKIPLSVVFSEFIESPEYQLVYLSDLLQFFPKISIAHKSLLIIQLIHIYLRIYPSYSDEFTIFINDYYDLIPFGTLNEIFISGCFNQAKLLSIKKQDPIIEMKIARIKNDNESMLNILSSYSSSPLINQLIELSFHAPFPGLSKFLIHFSHSQLFLPLIISMPLCCTHVCHNFLSKPEKVLLLLYTYCRLHEENKIIDLIQNSVTDLSGAYRITSAFRMEIASSIILYHLGFIEKSIEKMYQICHLQAFSIITKYFSFDRYLSFKYLLSICTKIQQQQLSTKLIDHIPINELLDYFPDTFSLQTVESNLHGLLKESNIETHVINCQPKNDISPMLISKNASCKKCTDPLWGQKIIIFPCGHIFHTKCLKNYGDNDSCPDCSFQSIRNLYKSST